MQFVASLLILLSVIAPCIARAAALERGVAITDPYVLRELDSGRFGIGRMVAPAAAPVAAAAAAPAAPAAPKESTGSIQTANAGQAPVPLPAPKPEVARLPTVEGWVLRDVGNGSALIEGRQGIFEVYAGDPIPGLGRIDAIRKQDGRWVVVTSRGLIVGR